MQIGYLGPLEVFSPDGAVEVPGRLVRTLLGRLAVDVGRPVSARVLIDTLWPDEAPSDPVNALQSLVSRLRRALGEPSVVAQVPGGYRLQLDPDDVDGSRFARLAAQGRAQLAAGSPGEAVLTLQAGLSLWRGAALEDDSSLDAEAVRRRLDELRLQLIKDRIECELALGRPADAASELEQLVRSHPLREDLTALLMRALVLVGRPAEALTAYESTRTFLAETLGSDPSPALQQQHLAVLRLERGATSPQTNLRASLTTFVGRADDVRAVDELLDRSRLVTIVGTGGAGKTRLASEAAAKSVGRLRDGVWFVELAPVTDPDNLALALLEAVGTRDVLTIEERTQRSYQDAGEQVLLTLADAECLIVVDNCEHVIEAAASMVSDLLARCGRVRVLATSREPLAIDGETLYALSPLGVPDAGGTAADAGGSPAVRLLVDRATAVGADLRVDEQTVCDVVEIVRRLDGLPLAIELAAARLRVLSVAEVATRLADRFRLLTGGRRTAMPRHRTLRAVVEWSWDLLTPLEREVAEHFSVFGSGAIADAVAAVCPSLVGRRVDAAGLDDVLLALVDKSLLVAGQDGGEVRYRMLETLREYGSERLTERGVVDRARARHARYFAGLVSEADSELRTRRQLTWLRRLDVERDDVLTALAYLGEHDEPVAAVRMAVELTWFWMLRGNGKDAARWLRFATGLPGAEESALFVLAEALDLVMAFARLDYALGEAERRQQLGDVADRLGESTPPHQVAAVVRPLLYFFAQDPDKAIAVAEDNLRGEDVWVRAATRSLRMGIADNEGDIESQRADLGPGLAEWEAIGDHWGIAAMLSSRGQLRTLDGDTEGAAADFEEALEHLRLLGGGGDRIMVNVQLADLRLRAGDVEGARRYADAVLSDDSYDDLSSGWGRFADIIVARVAIEQGDEVSFAAARDRLLATLVESAEPPPFHAHVAASSHAFLGSVAASRGELLTARHHIGESLRLALGTNDGPILAGSGIAVAAWALASGADREAAVLLGATARLRGSPDATERTIARLTRELRQRLGADFDTAYAEGLGLSREAAIAALAPELVESARHAQEPAILRQL